MRRPYVIAHRGASGYEYENSRAAFRRAVMLDADGVELDVHATRDGAIVVHHDAEIPGFGPIALLSRHEARQVRIRNGETLPLLSEVLDLVGNRAVYVELKSLPEVHDQELLDGNSGPRLRVSPVTLLTLNSDGPAPPRSRASPRKINIVSLPTWLLMLLQYE